MNIKNSKMIINPKNEILSNQIAVLANILQLNKTAWRILEVAEKLIPYDWYLAGGGIYHTIWNYYSQMDPEDNIKDYDVFYFNPEHDENDHSKLEKILNKSIGKSLVDLSNIATIHLWLKDSMNKDISPYISIEEDIVSFGSSINCIGVRRKNKSIEVFAPYGLHDIFSMETHYLGGIFTKEEYIAKCKSWQVRWPNLVIH